MNNKHYKRLNYPGHVVGHVLPSNVVHYVIVKLNKTNLIKTHDYAKSLNDVLRNINEKS